ncbi:MAG: hypothetical protein IIC13_18200 [SAR324 cluster bacterium]|nr:hypothetical protein [SAR324 cluster bacterium]
MVKAKRSIPARILPHGLAGCLLMALLISLLAGFPAAALGQSGNLYFFSVKGGQLDTSTSGDTFIDYLATTEGHGALQTSRQEDTINFEQDIYAISASGRVMSLPPMPHRPPTVMTTCRSPVSLSRTTL